MRLDLIGRIAEVFDQIFIGGADDAAWSGQHGTAIEDMTGGLHVSAHKSFCH